MDNIEKLKHLADDYTIMVVEDSNILQKQIVTLVSKFFSTVFTANDGSEGIDKYLEYKPNIILCDILMPNFDGLDMIEQMIKINPDVKVIIISAHADTEHLLRAFHLGARDFIPKPINLDLLTNALIRVLGELKKDYTNKDNSASSLQIEQKYIDELNIIKEKNIKVNLINHYKGVPIIHEAYIIGFDNNKIELRTQDIQNVVIDIDKKTLIDSELLSKDILVYLDYIDEKTNNIFVKDPHYVDISIKQRADVRVQPDESFKFIINDAHGNIDTKVLDCSKKAICLEVSHIPQDYEIGKKVAISFTFEMNHSQTFNIKNNDYIGAYATIFRIEKKDGLEKLVLHLELSKGDEQLLSEYIYKREIALIQELKFLIKKK